MAPRKLSPKREKKEEKKEGNSYDMKRLTGYGAMGLYTLLCLAAVTSAVFYIVYASESHGRRDDAVDDYEHHFGRMQIAAYGAMIALLGAILILLAWVAYNVHRNSGPY